MLFDVGIMAVTLDLSEYHMFCGGMDGSIFQVDLCAWVSAQSSAAPLLRCGRTGGPGFLRLPALPRRSADPAAFGLPLQPLSPSSLPPFLQPVQRDRTFQTERENGKVFKGHR